MQLHCNFPHHRKGVIEYLKCQDENKESVKKAIQKIKAEDLETHLSERSLCAAMVRTPVEWQAHLHCQALATLPLLEIIKIGDSPPEQLPPGPRPLSGIKMLDLSRVVAGPACSKTLAEHGANVMLISCPSLPSIAPLVMDTGFGKLSAFLDLNPKADQEKLKQLLRSTDIFLQAYRPGGIEDKGFSPKQAAQLRPGIIYISLSAYSHLGPWASRHGYDSLVQSATGIVAEQSQNIIKKPQHLPAQSLDYLTGYLAAFGALEALKRRTEDGGSYLVRLSLVQTAQWLKQLGRSNSSYLNCAIPTREQILPLLTQSESAFGKLEHLKPVLKLSETSPFLDKPTVPLGSHDPVWPMNLILQMRTLN